MHSLMGGSSAVITCTKIFRDVGIVRFRIDKVLLTIVLTAYYSLVWEKLP